VIRNLCGALLATMLATVAAFAGPANGSIVPTCSQSLVQPFAPWLDYANYALVPNGSLERTTGWTLSGGARIELGNEPFRVNSPKDMRSLLLPSGSSATSPAVCMTVLHPTLRFFAMNGGSLLAALKVEVITTSRGVKTTLPIGLLLADGNWRPTLPLAFLSNLTALTPTTVQFRFTPTGRGSGWRIDDVYVDPFRQR
jgi:hypothetical protein